MAPSSDESSGGRDNNENDNNEDEIVATETIPMSSIFYVMESFKATATPVSITMVLSALATNFIRTEESAQAREETLTSSYSAIAVDEDASSSEQLGIGLVNGLIIIGFITVMTFGVVILYKYRCMCFLKGYLVLSITFLLGYFGGVMFYEAIQRYRLWITKISYALVLYNFTIVGVYALFVGKGVPAYVGQGYLIAISVILAWELSNFSDVLAWVLLVLLALYDLYAVLTPCGPLNALVNLMGREGAEQIPALLYEAQLPPEARRERGTQRGPQAQQTRSASTNTVQAQQSAQPTAPSASAQPEPQQVETSFRPSDGPADNSQLRPGQRHSVQTDNQLYDQRNVRLLGNTEAGRQGHHAQTQASGTSEEKKDDGEPDTIIPQHPQHLPEQQTATPAESQQAAISVLSRSRREMVVSRSQDEFETVERPTDTIPLAIAKLYKLPLVDGRSTEEDFTAEDPKSMVSVYYPRQGGRMERVPTPTRVESTTDSRPSRWRRRRNSREQQPVEPQVVHYNVIDRHGEIKRTIFVGDDGKVYRVLDEEEQEEQEQTTPSSIKLGLGDFIFYSVLVSKASTHSFTTFAACMMAILAGLLLTLVLLAIRGKALPALPISIFLGVLFYLPTRYVFEPYIHNLFWNELYV